MSLSSLSIQRKVAMSCFTILLVILGLKNYYKIGLDKLPKINVPYITVTTVFPGASPEEIETDIAKKIEDAVGSMDGLKHITSICMENVLSITFQFVNGTNVDITMHEVREKINTIANQLPPMAETPLISKIDTNSIAVVTLFLSGEATIDELYDYVDDKLSDYFSSVKGVAEVRVHGGNEVQLHVLLDRKKMAACNITVNEIIGAISANNTKIPLGRVHEDGHEITVTYDAEFKDLDSFRQLEVGNFAQGRVYLGDIAQLELKSKEIRQEAWQKTGDELKSGILIEVVKKGDANAVKTIAGVKEKYDLLQSGQLPGGMTLEWFIDNGAFIEASVADAWKSIGMGILLTVILLYLFLHEIRSTLICALTMPISIIISFFAMKYFNYTFDMMTLLSMGCSAGVLVGNAVVVIENIYKKLDEGKSPDAAAADGAGEVVNAVAASALTNIVVFAPVIMMETTVGDLLSPFASVMVIVTVVSLFSSFTLAPMLASILLKKHDASHSDVISRSFDYVYNLTESAYCRSMVWVSKHSGITLILLILICAALCGLVGSNVSMAFMPSNDESKLSVVMEFPSNTSLEGGREKAMNVVNEIHKLSAVEKTALTLGYRNSTVGQINEGTHLAEVTIKLKPKDQRKMHTEVMTELRAIMAKQSGMLYNVGAPTPLGSTDSDLVAYVAGPDLDVVQEYALKGAEMLITSGTGADVDTNCRTGKPRISIIPNRPILKNMGITASDLGTAAMGYFDGVEAGTYKIGERSYDIRVKAAEKEGFDAAYDIIAGSLNGRPINFDVLTNKLTDSVFINIIREDKERSAWIYAYTAPGHAVGDMINVLDEKLAPVLPQGYRMGYFGQVEMMKETTAEFVDVFLTAIILTYLVIAAIMESWLRPFLVMFAIPPGFIGMVFAVYATNSSMSLISLLGGVMMIGIVVNNAILITDECSVLEKNGMSTREAMLQAVKNKFRPVLMTSIASIIGMLPMAFGSGIGSEMRSSCGIGVVGGLTFSAILTIYLIPAFYFFFAKKEKEPAKA